MRERAASAFGADKRKQAVVCAAAALLCAFFLRYAVPAEARMLYSMSVIPLFAAGACFLLFSKTLGSLSKDGLPSRKELCSFAGLALLLSAFFVFGAGSIGNTTAEWLKHPLLYVAVLVDAIPFIAGLLLAWRKLSEVDRRPSQVNVSKRSAILVFVGLLLCWTPVLLAAWPGFFNYDMGSNVPYGEWAQYSTGDLNDHHSVLHTLASGAVIELGRNLFGNFNAGVALLTCLQILVLAAIFTYAIGWMAKRGCPKLGLVAAFAYFALDPTISMFAVSTNSDTLFSGMAVLLVMKVYDLLAPEGTKRKRALFVSFAIVAVLFCVLRPNGLYAFVFAVPFLLIFVGHEARRKLFLTIMAALAVVFLWNGPLAYSLGVQSSTMQKLNALSVPLQQLGHVAANDLLSEDEKELLQRNGYRAQPAYDPDLVDVARGNVSGMSATGLLECWVSVGLGHPFDYLEAFILQTEDAWSPYAYSDAARYSSTSEAAFFAPGCQPPAESDSKMPLLLDALSTYSRTLLVQGIPFVALLVCIPFYVYLLLIGFVVALLRKDRGALGVFVLLGLVTCSALLGPGVIPRYYLCDFFCAPLMLLLTFGAGEGRAKASPLPDRPPIKGVSD